MKKKRALSVLVFCIAAAIYGQYGFQGKLTRDDANLLYSAQRMAEGEPPYVSMFNHTVPLPPLLAGLGVMAANRFGWNDLAAVRFLFFIIGCASVVGIYLLCSHLFQSWRDGMIGALVYMGFAPFAAAAVSGPQKKTPMVLFEVLCLLMMTRKRWFWTGLFGSLSFLCWQAMGFYPILALILAVLDPDKGAPARIFRILAGVLSPFLPVGFYFYHHHALGEWFEGAILFNLRFIDRGETTLLDHLLKPIGVIGLQSGAMLLPILIGFIVMIYLYGSRLCRYPSLREGLVKDPYAPMLFSFPAPIVWSFIDFQSIPDFYVFLPYVAVGFGFFLIRAAQAFRQGDEPGKIVSGFGKGGKGMVIGLFAALLAFAQFNAVRSPKLELVAQKKGAREIEQRFGKDMAFMSLGTPELLVLLRRKNPTPYVFIVSGIDRRIHAKTPGGFGGWLRSLDALGPEVIGFGPTQGIHTHQLIDWLNSKYERERIGPWTIFVKLPLHGKGSP